MINPAQRMMLASKRASRGSGGSGTLGGSDHTPSPPPQVWNHQLNFFLLLLFNKIIDKPGGQIKITPPHWGNTVPIGYKNLG